MDGNITLIHRIAALHIVYEKNKSQVLWFGQLVAYSPEIMIHLNRDKVYDKEEMVLQFTMVYACTSYFTIISTYIQILHLRAVEQALVNLVPPLDKDNPASSLTPWLNEVRVAQNAITSIINLPSQSAIRVESRYIICYNFACDVQWSICFLCRLKWEVIRVLQLFLEHVLLKTPFQNSVAYLIRLTLVRKSYVALHMKL